MVVVRLCEAGQMSSSLDVEKLEHPHILGVHATANQNSDEYLQVYTDLEVYDERHPEYDEKLVVELREAVRKFIGKSPPFEGDLHSSGFIAFRTAASPTGRRIRDRTEAYFWNVFSAALLSPLRGLAQEVGSCRTTIAGPITGLMSMRRFVA